MSTTPMTRKQKAALAEAVIRHVADLAEFADEKLPDELLACDRDEVRRQLARWMNWLPGDFWDRRLP